MKLGDVQGALANSPTHSLLSFVALNRDNLLFYFQTRNSSHGAALVLGGTAITKGKTPVSVCSPELSPVGRG